ncbi:MAG: ribosome biogenesis protein [Nitrososphaerota archaeon]|nr:ribosome biogenesis protein [Nitrososphaerota archaeon]
MLNLLIVEAALETVPESLWNHPAVKKHAAKKGKKPGEILLDRSYHHSAMLKLENSMKRGRPDLVHFSLLEACSTPLYLLGLLKVYVHTINDVVIRIGTKVRLPKSYFRFEGLMEQLFKQRRIKSNSEILLEMERMSFSELLAQIKPPLVIGLSRIGEESNCQKVAKELSLKEGSAVVVGGFPRGHFSTHISSHFDRLYSIHRLSLEAHTVIARIIYEYEKQVGVSN